MCIKKVLFVFCVEHKLCYKKSHSRPQSPLETYYFYFLMFQNR